MIKFNNYSFGATSAVMTSLAIIIGLSSTINAKVNIITALLIIAIADNISDSFGIHIHQESQLSKPKEVRKITTVNFLARFLITAIFVLFIILLPLHIALILSIIYGLSIIILLSYFISKQQKANPYRAIFQHLLLAIILMIASFLLRELIADATIKIIK